MPAFVPGDTGELWVACDNTSEGQLREIRDGRVAAARSHHGFSVAYRDREGTVWFAGPTALAHLRGNRMVVTAQLPADVRGRPVQGAVARRQRCNVGRP